MDLAGSIDAYFSSIEGWEKAIGKPTLSYVAVRQGGQFELLQARLMLGAATTLSPIGVFSSDNVRAGSFLLADVDLDPQGFVKEALEGCIRTPQGEISFIGNGGNQYGGHYQPFHADGTPNDRIGVLTLLGGNRELHHLKQDLDWELKASEEPFDSLQELMNHYRVGVLRLDSINIEIVALGIVAVDLSTIVTGTDCELAVRMSPDGDQHKAALSYRVMGGDKIERRRVSGDAMEWSDAADGARRGSVRIQVPNASVIQAYASYDGVVYHQGWIADPTTAQNARRAAYEAFDAKLTALSDLLTKPPGKGNARDLEAGIAWLLWMLGFNVAHMGNIPKLQEAPDLLVTTPLGNFAVVECTTGPLKTDNKLPLLIERSEMVRERLAASNNSHLKVLPVIVTSKRRLEIRADIEQAERLGVLIVTAETLQAVLPRTLFRVDPEQIFLEGEREVSGALAKYQVQEVLSLQGGATN
jgi:hypothetical protein